MTDIHFLSGPLDDEARGDLLFRGDILVFRDLAPMRALALRADTIVRAAFGAGEPERAQERLDRDAFVAAARAARSAFRTDGEVAALARAVLEAAGAAVARTYWDRLILRVMPSGATHSARRIERLGPHRDSWGSNLMAQVNWWAPVYPVTPERSIALFPAYFDRPLANSSAEWDVEALRARQKAAAAGEAVPPYPLLPEPREPVDAADALRLALSPGDLLCFSSAHLHASVPNETGRVRFSTEMRTVSLDDLAAGRGAPNVDGRAPHVVYDWFTAVTDGSPLAQVARRSIRTADNLESHR